MNIFDHEGCHSGKCIFKAHAVACLVLREISDAKNHEHERRLTGELLNEAARLMDESKNVGITPPLPERPEIEWPPIEVGKIVEATIGVPPTTIVGEVLEYHPPWIRIRQGGGELGGNICQDGDGQPMIWDLTESSMHPLDVMDT